MDILRFITAGNVDDGKSTLIGRLLYDTGNINTDVLQSVMANGNEQPNLAFITDGLRAERQQGITIDVAYKYFTTPQRKYIITDAPGHVQFTGNLVTGASGADLMVILVDVLNGITEQTKRHSLVAAFLNIGHVVVAVNKMDAAGYNEAVFLALKEEYAPIARQLKMNSITFVPVSGLLGHNVTFQSAAMPWYRGKTLLQLLEQCQPVKKGTGAPRLEIQHTANTGPGPDNCGFTGKVLSGSFSNSDEVVIYPDGQRAVIEKILHGYEEVSTATAGQNICIYFNTAVDARRGCIVATAASPPLCNTRFTARLFWLDAQAPLQTGKDYLLRVNSQLATCTITIVLHKTDIHTLGPFNDGLPVTVNQFATVMVTVATPMAYDRFADLPSTGRCILIDMATNNTCGALVIEAPEK